MAGEADRIKQLENGLKWISQLAMVHARTGVLDPDHMRIISNMCFDILAGTDPLPDFDDLIQNATESARKLAARLEQLGD